MLTRKRILIGVAALLVLAGVGAYFVLSHGPGNVSNPNVAFEDETPTPTASPVPGKEQPEAKPFLWTTYGYTPDRKRSLDVPASLVKPPFHQRWAYNGKGVLEFPPVMSAKSLFIVRNDGTVQCIYKTTGKVRWSKHVGTLAASSPMLDVKGERLYVTLLERSGGGGGRVVALDTRQGHVVWHRDLPGRTESSPTLDHGSLYFGSENGTVYALKASSGAVRWTFHASGAVKAALALKDGKLYFGDYAGRAYAVRAASGKLVWEAKTKGAKFGFASGRFYGNAAVSNGRVFIGNLDGYVYSFSAASGELAWRTKTNGYVYGSPSIGAGPGGKPTVFIGSYDGTFYALDARSGAVRWRYRTGGAISGGSTVLGHTVWLGDIRKRLSYALDTRSGKKVYGFRKGGYATVITDMHTLYLVGYGAMYALEPLTEEKRRTLAAAKVRRKQQAVQRRRDCAHRANRLYTRPKRKTQAFRACVKRRHASHIPLHKIREVRERAQRKPHYKIPPTFRGLIKQAKG
jgi:outer membrane protein assembly factor BamB